MNAAFACKGSLLENMRRVDYTLGSAAAAAAAEKKTVWFEQRGDLRRHRENITGKTSNYKVTTSTIAVSNKNTIIFIDDDNNSNNEHSARN